MKTLIKKINSEQYYGVPVGDQFSKNAHDELSPGDNDFDTWTTRSNAFEFDSPKHAQHQISVSTLFDGVEIELINI